MCVYSRLVHGVHGSRKCAVLTRYMPKKKARKEKSLLAGANEEPEPEEPEVVRDNVTLLMVLSIDNAGRMMDSSYRTGTA